MFDPIILLLLVVVLASVGCSSKSASPPPAPPPQVIDVTVKRESVPIYGDWVATLDGYVNANIQPQVSGYLIRQTYREGSFVHKGDVLFEIDQRPFQAVLDQPKDNWLKPMVSSVNLRPNWG